MLHFMLGMMTGDTDHVKVVIKVKLPVIYIKSGNMVRKSWKIENIINRI